MLGGEDVTEDGLLFSGAIDEHALGKELFNPSPRGGFQRGCLVGVERLSPLLLEKQSHQLGVGSHLFFKATEVCLGVPLILKFFLEALEDFASYCRVEAYFSSNNSLIVVGLRGRWTRDARGLLDTRGRGRFCLLRKKVLTLPRETR